MSWLPAFAAWPYAVAGLLAAAATVLLHLWPRPPRRVIAWPAIEFLATAIERHRRWPRWRDRLLMLCRAAAVALLGLAVAGPRLPGTTAGGPSSRLVLIVDRSASMARRIGGQSLLDAAKARAVALLADLPESSRIAVLAWPEPVSSGERQPAVLSKSAALQAVERVEIREGPAAFAGWQQDLDRIAAEFAPHPPSVVLITDRQRTAWREWLDATEKDPPAGPRRAPGVRLAACVEPPDDALLGNAWIAELSLQDAIADAATPATVLCEVRWCGLREATPRRLTLRVAGQSVATRSIELPPGDGVRQFSFQHLFAPGGLTRDGVTYAALQAELNEDVLPLDDHREHVAPLAAGAPLVFIDELGDQEQPERGRWGASRPLRRLIESAWRTAGGEGEGGPTPAVTVRHLRMDQVRRESLADARLVAACGLADPTPIADMLTEYVAQGGRLLVTAGGSGKAVFDPADWNRAAWRDGAGFLPGLLQETLLGGPSEAAASEFRPLEMETTPLPDHAWFRPAGASPRDLAELFREPLFFQAAAVDLERTETMLRSRPAAAGPAASWLRFSVEDAPTTANPGASPPRLLARLADAERHPLLLERRFGRGRVVLLTTGLETRWSTLAQTNAFLLLDRILRDLLRDSIASRNFPTGESLRLPLADAGSGEWFRLRPSPLDAVEPTTSGQNAELLPAGFLGPLILGVTIDSLAHRGLYRVEPVAETSAAAPVIFAAVDDSNESDLAPLQPEDLQRLRDLGVAWLEPEDQWPRPATEGSGVADWLAAGAALLLLGELLLLLQREPVRP